MGMMGGPFAAIARPLGLAEGVRLAERALANLGNPDLTFDEVHAFALNFYVPVYEKSTRAFAFELLVDRYTGQVMTEPGPSMMWNTKYGMMGGASPVTVATPVTEEQALRLAQQFLEGFLPGARAGEVHTFYGYRTIDIERDGRMVGMLSVNGYTGQVWYHAWHGDFLETWHRGP